MTPSLYLLVKAVHVLAAMALVGPLLLAPRWLARSREATGQAMLHQLHVQTGVAGWIVLLAGAAMVGLQPGLLALPWVHVPLALFLGVQVFDHAWADRREDEVARDSQARMAPLRAWLYLKLALYGFITLMMVLRWP